MAEKSKVAHFYAVRLVIFSVVYFLFIEAAMLLGYILLYPQKQGFDSLILNIEYIMDVQDTDFTVTRVEPLVAVDGTKGVRLTFRSPMTQFTEDVYEDYNDIEKGWVYKGYEVSYKAMYKGEEIERYKAQIFYYGQNQDSVTTLDDFKVNVSQTVYEKEMLRYDSIYRRNFVIFFSLSAGVLILLLYLRFKRKYLQKLRRIQLLRMQSEKGKESEE